MSIGGWNRPRGPVAHGRRGGRGRTGERCGEAGFTLFEVMVAFVIAALALGMLFAGGLAGLRTAKIADGYGDALSRARSRIAAIVAPQPLDIQGDDGGGYRFHLRVTSAGVVTPAHDAALGQALGQATTRVGLYDVSVVVSWHGDGGERQVALATQRLGLVPPAPP